MYFPRDLFKADLNMEQNNVHSMCEVWIDWFVTMTNEYVKRIYLVIEAICIRTIEILNIK